MTNLTSPSRLTKLLSLGAIALVAVVSLWALLFMAVGSLPPEPTPESVEMGAPR